MTINELNNLKDIQRRTELEKCCGSTTWINKMANVFPVMDEEGLLNVADEKWAECSEKDWLEAFTHHPKIGDVNPLKEKFASTAAWASGEQAGMQTATDEIIDAFVNTNAEYEQKFGFIFIVCATGKSAVEMLEMLNKRMSHDREYELHMAAAEQAKITRLRLKKLTA